MTKSEQPHLYFRGFIEFHRNVKLVFLSNLLSSIQLGVFIVLQPLYLNSIGFPSSTIGVLIGATSIFSTIFLIPSGIISDRISKKWVLIASTSAYLLSFMIYALFDSFSFLLLASLLSGFSWGAWTAPYTAIIADNVEQVKRSHAFSISAFLFTSGSIVGSIIAGGKELIESTLLLTPLDSYKIIFWLSIVLGVSSLVPLIFLKEESRERTSKGFFTIHSWKVIGKFSLINAFIGLGAGLFITLVPLYLNFKFSASETEIGVLFAISNAIMALSYFTAPKLMEIMGPVKAIISAQVPAILLLTIIPFSPIFSIAAFLYIGRTILMNFAHPIYTTFAMNLVDKEERSLASSITTMAWNGTSAIGTMIGGQLMEIQIDLPAFICSVSYALSTILLYLFFKSD